MSHIIQSFTLAPGIAGGDGVRIAVPDYGEVADALASVVKGVVDSPFGGSNVASSLEAIVSVTGANLTTQIMVGGSHRSISRGNLYTPLAPTAGSPTTVAGIANVCVIAPHPTLLGVDGLALPQMGVLTGIQFSLPSGMTITASRWATIGFYANIAGTVETLQAATGVDYATQQAALDAGALLAQVAPSGRQLIGFYVFQNAASTFTAGTTPFINGGVWAPVVTLDYPLRGMNGVNTLTTVITGQGEATLAGVAGNGVWRFPVSGLRYMHIRTFGSQTTLPAGFNTISIRVSFMAR